MSTRAKALFIGEDTAPIAELRSYFGDLDMQDISSFDELMSTLESNSATDASLVFTVNGFSDVPIPEMAQFLRAGFQTQPIYFVTFDTQNFDRQILIKNGYTDAFLLPIDKDYMLKRIGKTIAASAPEAFSAVRLVDIEPDTKLEFEVAIFMPRNNKHIPLIHQGDRLGRERLERLKSFKQSTLFVPVSQMQAFYDYSARRIVELEDGSRSSTERSEKLQDSIRDFVTGILSASYSKNPGQGHQTTDNIRKVVERYISLKNPNSVYQKILDEVGQSGDSYSHTGRVSTFAALFSIALRLENTEEVASAGILHDIGMTLLPTALQTKPEAKMTKEEKELHQTHPLLSLEAAQKRKLLLSDQVVEAVTQHHERFKGGGYPANLTGRRIKPTAQIVALADCFDYLTRLEANVSPLEPEQALRRMSDEGIANPDLLLELQRTLKKQKEQAARAA